MFALIGKILSRDEGWTLRLYDKRETYQRTHRLRIAPEPYLAIQKDLNDPRFDALIEFLRARHFSPEVNLLEEVLTEQLAGFGVRKTVLELGDGFRLADLRRRLESEGALPALFTIVAADSVHSTVRQWVAGSLRPERHTHERVARIRVVGPDLPARLGVADQFRLAKVLQSVVDYRVNQNGFAEVDLFVTEREHRLVRQLGATPKEPVEISTKMLRRLDAPLFRSIVEQLERESRTILLQSTFQLEHQLMRKVVFDLADVEAKVFLLGDAAVSLPFFRGMACLGSCAHALARRHVERAFDAYQRDVDAIVKREVPVVRARAQLVRGLRELVRVSSMLPFPIQSWWLSAKADPLPDAIAPSTHFNLLIALGAAVFAAAGIVLPALLPVSLLFEAAGGFAFRWTLALEPGPHRYLRRVWEVQIAVLGALGVGSVAVLGARWVTAVWWWVLGLTFAAGLYLFERTVNKRLSGADLDEGR
jgi:hypothetical protein